MECLQMVMKDMVIFQDGSGLNLQQCGSQNQKLLQELYSVEQDQRMGCGT